jgi:hypothetical protein
MKLEFKAILTFVFIAFVFISLYFLHKKKKI